VEDLWESWLEGWLLRGARWLACPAREVKPRKGAPSIEDVSSAFALEEQEKVDEALDFCRWLWELEEERTRILETKAITLTGFAGVTAAVVLGIAALLLDASKLGSIYASGALLILYVVLVYCFVRTVLCALMVVTVGGRYRFHHPASADILAIRSKTVLQIQAQRAVDYFDSYLKNRAINEDKAGYLISAQQAFAVAALLLFLMTLFVAAYMLALVLGPWLHGTLVSTFGWLVERIRMY
jgi:hypothetical protein